MTDPVISIQRDHRVLAALVGRLADPYGDRTTLVEQVAALLIAHLRAEEKIHPLLSGSELDEYAAAHHGVPASGEAEERLRILRATDPASTDFDLALHEFAMTLERHADAEESDILLHVYDRVDPDTMHLAGVAFAERRAEELRAYGFDADPGSDAYPWEKEDPWGKLDTSVS